MKHHLKIITLFFFLTFVMTGCKEWIIFDLSRMTLAFIISLIVGIIGFILAAINGGNKKN